MIDEPVALPFGGEDINEMIQEIHTHQVSECGNWGTGDLEGPIPRAPGREGVRGNVCRTCLHPSM